MTWNVSAKEFESVVALPADKRYSHFVKRAADWQTIWSLRNDEGWVLAADPSGCELVPVWPHAAYAEACATGEWTDCKPASIELDAWMDRWIPGIEQDGQKIAVFPVAKKGNSTDFPASAVDNGVVVEPRRLLEDLVEERGNYE